MGEAVMNARAEGAGAHVGAVSASGRSGKTVIPKPRSPGLAFEATLPRHWFAGNVVATHIANGVNLLFPAGERFFVRSVHHYLDQVKSPELQAQAKGFFGQEGRHAKEHERMFDTLREQGYPIDRFLALYERVAYQIIEKVAPTSLALATTAAAEHYTAIMAENALRMNLLQNAHPTIRALLHWHAAEEIEHRSVAFDVLNEVAPGYGLRMAGLAMATVCLAGFWIMATSMLLASDPDATVERIIKDFRLARQARLSRDPNAKGTTQAVFLRGIREYMRPDFHPSQSDIDHLAEQYLTSVGMA